MNSDEEVFVELENTPDFESNNDQDWSGLLQHRITDIHSIEKLKAVRPDFSEEVFRSRVDSVFSQTRIGSANRFNKEPKHGGIGFLDSPGTVFTDAIDKVTGNKLNVRQKNVLEAHEKLHGTLNDLSDEEKKRIRKCFIFNDNNSLNGYSDDKLEVECLARMSQLKNYFGFDATKKFTKEHLRYAKENYVRQVGWDNNMTDFFNAIPEDKEDDFVDLMNTLVC